MYIRSILFCLSVSIIGTTISNAQTTYTDTELGYTVDVPDGWTYETKETGELAFRASASEAVAFFDLNLKKLTEGQTSYDYLLYLESFMGDAGYSENFVEADKQSLTGDDAAFYNADDVALGVYTKEKDGVTMIQTVIIYREGIYAYLTIGTCTKDDSADLQPAYDIMNGSFKLLE